MKRLLTVIVLLTLVIFGVGFSVLNADSVPLNYYFARSEFPLAIIVLCAFVVGALFGSLANLGYVFSQRVESKRLRRKITLIEQEVKNLREIPLRDKH